MVGYLVTGIVLSVLGWYAWKKEDGEPTGGNPGTWEPSITGGGGPLSCDDAVNKLPAPLQSAIAKTLATNDPTQIVALANEFSMGAASGKIDPQVGHKVAACLSEAAAALPSKWGPGAPAVPPPVVMSPLVGSKLTGLTPTVTDWTQLPEDLRAVWEMFMINITLGHLTNKSTAVDLLGQLSRLRDDLAAYPNMQLLVDNKVQQVVNYIALKGW